MDISVFRWENMRGKRPLGRTPHRWKGSVMKRNGKMWADFICLRLMAAKEERGLM